jgi:hypothetical protein
MAILRILRIADKPPGTGKKQSVSVRVHHLSPSHLIGWHFIGEAISRMICREIVDEIRGVLSKAIVHPRSFRSCEHRNASSPEPFSNSE